MQNNTWQYFADMPVGAIFTFGASTVFLKTSNATFREMGGFDRFQRVYAEKDLGKLLFFKKMKRS